MAVSAQKKTPRAGVPARSPQDEMALDAAGLISSAATSIGNGQVPSALRALKQLVHVCERGAAHGLPTEKLQGGIDALDGVFRNGDAEQRAQALMLLDRLEAVRLSLRR